MLYPAVMNVWIVLLSRWSRQQIGLLIWSWNEIQSHLIRTKVRGFSPSIQCNRKNECTSVLTERLYIWYLLWFPLFDVPILYLLFWTWKITGYQSGFLTVDCLYLPVSSWLKHFRGNIFFSDKLKLMNKIYISMLHAKWKFGRHGCLKLQIYDDSSGKWEHSQIFILFTMFKNPDIMETFHENYEYQITFVSDWCNLFDWIISYETNFNAP